MAGNLGPCDIRDGSQVFRTKTGLQVLKGLSEQDLDLAMLSNTHAGAATGVRMTYGTGAQSWHVLIKSRSLSGSRCRAGRLAWQMLQSRKLPIRATSPEGRDHS